MSTRAFVVAGTASGVGKTTVAVGLCAALRARGLRIQPFKAGPDYIDPTYLGRAAGEPCRNLDTWMIGEEAVRELYARAVRNADVAVVEGVMGLFDGHADGAGSASDLARVLDLPCVLVVDAQAMAQSAGAIVLGFRDYDPNVRIAGVILNRVASTRHAEMCAGAIRARTGLPVFGALPRSADVSIPERYLGLIPETEQSATDAWVHGLVALIEEHVDVDALLAHADTIETHAPQRLFPEPVPTQQTTIAIARDEAFHFYYEDSLDLLRAWGAEIELFSPLTDSALPAEVGAIYLGGGFPELFATELANNAAMGVALRAAAKRGVPIYGECGGLMYLGRSITDAEGAVHPMVGLVPADSVMAGSRLTLGYREIESLGTPLLPAGQHVRGHEFHWSTLKAAPIAAEAAYRVTSDGGRADGFRAGSVTATYVHTHLGARADLAPNFVAAAQAASSTGARA